MIKACDRTYGKIAVKICDKIVIRFDDCLSNNWLVGWLVGIFSLISVFSGVLTKCFGLRMELVICEGHYGYKIIVVSCDRVNPPRFILRQKMKRFSE